MDETVLSVMAIARHHVGAESAFALDNPDTDLSALGIDSIEMVSLILDIEAHFVVEFPASMMVAETFRNVRTIADSLQALQKQKA